MYSCKPGEIKECDHTVLVVLAHPDDETLISGTLAKFISHGCDITVVYSTSGDDGPDMTSQGLHGDALAKEREKEALKSLTYIGCKKPPVFLRFPDSHVYEHADELRDTLTGIFRYFEPEVIITFGPDGVTNDLDHITTGSVTDQVFDRTDTGKLLLHLAISQTASYIYPIPAPVDDQQIDFRVDVSDYKRTRIKSNSAHRTQFGFGNRLFWRSYVRRFPLEEFVVYRNLDGDQILQDCL